MNESFVIKGHLNYGGNGIEVWADRKKDGKKDG